MTVARNRFYFAVIFFIVVGSAYVLPVADWVLVLADWGREHPVAGPLAYILFVVLATVLFLPGSVAMMIGGFVFGFLPGLMFAAIAIPLGAQCAFEFGRWVARPWIRRKMANNRRMQLIEGALQERPILIIILTRLSLIIPFNLLNYVYGATSVRAGSHLLATAVGMLPAVALFAYFGTLARDISQILAGDAAPSELGYSLFAVGLIAIAILSWVIHRTASRVLERQLDTKV
jgi:uncharacterized membrane protein YdjX (TVP38/TMEM64 family)